MWISRSPTGTTRTIRVTWPLLLAVALTVPLILLAVRARDYEPPPVVEGTTAEVQPPARPSRIEGLSVLRRWDRQRAAAWAAADEDALAALYTEDSAAGVTDRAMLRRWSERGLVIESMDTQVKGATVIAISPRRLVIAITDRVVGARAVGAAGEQALPSDRWSTRRVTLRLVADEWLVAGVRTA